MDGKLLTTPSRIMWMITHGDIPAGQYVVTTCGIRNCVNPAHLKTEIATKVIDSLETKFWKRVIKTDGCWLWTGAITTFGYGHIHLGMGKFRDAHRVSWGLHNGDVPEGLSVLHHCDNPPCTRPDHLFVGTQADNVEDMDRKGRRVNAQPIGEKHWKSRVTENDILTMRHLRSAGVPISKLAEQFKMSYRNAWVIVTRRGWRHIS